MNWNATKGRTPGLSRKVKRRLVCAGLTLGAALSTTLVPQIAAPAQAALIYQVHNYDNDGTSGVYLRNSANINDVNRDAAHYVLYNTNVELICAEFGSAVGSHSNTAWDYVKVTSGPLAGHYGHLSEHWINTPVASGQHVPGEPACGVTPTPTPTPPPTSTGSKTTPIWIGAPFAGYWPGPPNSTGSLPANHPPILTIFGHAYKGNFAMDYYGIAGTRAYVYAAPKDSNLANFITANVVNVRPTCGSGIIADGGYQVQVALFHSGVKVGTVVYGHINPDFNNDGTTNSADINFRGAINRWGGYIGKVGAYHRIAGGCWDVTTTGGQHTHMELSNESGYACYRPGVANHQLLGIHDYIGYLGGSYVSGPKMACPNGV